MSGALGGIGSEIGRFLLGQGERVVSYYVDRAVQPRQLPPAPIIQLPPGTPGSGTQGGGTVYGTTSPLPTGELLKIVALFAVGLVGYAVVNKFGSKQK